MPRLQCQKILGSRVEHMGSGEDLKVPGARNARNKGAWVSAVGSKESE